jgi:two-component system LytT family response regulator
MRIFVVDDEPLARRKLSALINVVPWAEQIGEACDGMSAVEAITRLRPDIVFLDIQMPELSGIQVVERLRMTRPAPAVVFTTAHNQYAVTAFELEAVDYLLKPFGTSRFMASLERARQVVEAQGASALLDRARVNVPSLAKGRGRAPPASPALITSAKVGEGVTAPRRLQALLSLRSRTPAPA